MSKLRPTSFDYLVMAISPALVVLLVGSLVFFLIEVFYEGEFQTRLCFIMACFTLATVGITRIAIELDAARASFYGLVLSGAMIFVAPRFAHIPIPLLIALLAVIWYSAHRLTWDCTLIDEEQDASGEGLLQRIGLDDRLREGSPQENSPKPPLWKRLFAPDQKKHAPGLTVVYFSLAALPIFGLLQGFIPASDAESRSRAFLCLIAYVGAALGLLLTTSLLGLRRYLRQRQIEMPADMTAAWLAVGGGLIAVVLIFATILPRSTRELQLGKAPITFTSQDQNARHGGWGKEGAKGDQQQGQGKNKDVQNPNGAPPDKQNQQKGPGQPQDQKDGEQGQGDSKEGEPKPGNGQGQQPQDQRQGQQPSGKTDSQNNQNQNNQDRGKQQGEAQNEPKQEGQKQDGQPQPGDRNPNPNNAEPNQQPRQGNAPQRNNPPNGAAPPAAPPMKIHFDPAATVPFLGWLLKILIVAAIVIGFLYALIRYRREFFAALKQLLADLADFWRSLFGGKRSHETALVAAPVERYRRFTELENPFRRGGGNLSPRQLVEATFVALESFARDHGWPREKEQTATEFADAISLRISDLAKESKWLADCYSRAAYSSEEVTSQVQSSLAAIWQRMEQLYGRIPPPAPPNF